MEWGSNGNQPFTFLAVNPGGTFVLFSGFFNSYWSWADPALDATSYLVGAVGAIGGGERVLLEGARTLIKCEGSRLYVYYLRHCDRLATVE